MGRVVRPSIRHSAVGARPQLSQLLWSVAFLRPTDHAEGGEPPLEWVPISQGWRVDLVWECRLCGMDGKRV